MTNAQAISELKLLSTMLERSAAHIRRQRKSRDSEKAMALADAAVKQDAITLAIAALSKEPTQ